LALCVRHRVSVLSSSMVPSRRYSEIGLHQFIAWLGGPTTATTSPSGHELGLISLVEGPGSAFDINTRPSSPGGIPGAGIEPLASEEVPDVGSGISSSSQMEGLNKSCMNTPGGGGSRLDPNQATASASSLSHRRIWWSSKSLNFSSNLLTSYRYASMHESR
jgi:hypothetical protein